MSESEPVGRRRFLADAAGWTSLAMLGGLAAAYGTLAAFVGRFLFPARRDRGARLYLSEVAAIAPGAALAIRLPDGRPVTVRRLGQGAEEEDFMALSSTCPHLGCQVHWEPQNDRFFCPCHNGIFTPEGKGIGGPPGDAGQSLPAYPLSVEGGLLYIEVPSASLAAGGGAVVLEGSATAAAPGAGPGHDPCLTRRAPCRGARA